MNRVEITERLEDGENPATLSIKHWEENRQIVEDFGTLTLNDVSGSECALCAWIDMHDSDCWLCPLCIVSGKACGVPGSLWRRVIGARNGHGREALLEAIDELLGALHKAEVQGEIPNR